MWKPPETDEVVDAAWSPPAGDTVVSSATSGGKQALGRFVQGAAGMVAGLPESVAVLADKIGEALPFLDEGKPLQQLTTYKTGQVIRDFAKQLTPVDESRPRSFLVDTLPQGAGSMTGAVMGGVAGKIAKVPAWAATALIGASAGGADAYDEAIKSGGTEDQAWTAFLMNAGLGTTEAVPIAGWLNRANKASGGRLREAIVSGAEETAQELLQQFGGNITASTIAGYDPERPWYQGGVEAGGAGLTLGTLGGALFHNKGRQHQAQAPKASNADTLQSKIESDPIVENAGEHGTPGVSAAPADTSREEMLKLQATLRGETPESQRLKGETSNIEHRTSNVEPEPSRVQRADDALLQQAMADLPEEARAEIEARLIEQKATEEAETEGASMAEWAELEKQGKAKSITDQAEQRAELDRLLAEKKISQDRYNELVYGGLTKAQYDRMMQKALTAPPKDATTALDAAAGTVTGQNEGPASDATAGEFAAEQMPAELNKAAPVTESTAESLKPRPPSKKRFRLNPRSDGVPDILDSIQELGGIRPPGKHAGGEYDGYRESVVGPARILISRSAAHGPDTIINELRSINAPGANRIETVDDLWTAIAAAVKGRDKLRVQNRAQRGEAKQLEAFQRRVIQADRPQKDSGKFVGVPARALLEGDTFEAMGQQFTVQDLEFDPSGDLVSVTVKDGPKFGVQTVDGNETLHIDKGSLQLGPEHDSTPAGLPPEATPEEGEAEFSLGGEFSFDAPESVDEQKARLQIEKQAAAERKAREDMLQRAGKRLTANTDERTGDMFAAPEHRETRTDTSGQGSLFSKTGERGEGSDIGRVQAIVANELYRTGQPMNRFTVVYRPDWQRNGRYVQAMVSKDGRVTINAAAPGMRSEATVRKVVREEAAHLLLSSREGREAIQRFVLEAMTPEIEQELRAAGYTGSRELLADEFIAKQARENTSWWQDLVQRVREWLARNGLVNLTPEETARAILRSLRNAERGTRNQLHASNATVSLQPGLVTIGGPDPMAITAHHGTPHKVDKFSTEKIGTGEGAQVYGWGLYFAENPEVATQYRKNLSASYPEYRDGRPVNGGIADKTTSARRRVEILLASTTSQGEAWQKIEQGKDWLGPDGYTEAKLVMAKGELVWPQKPGNEYTVQLDADPDQLLDWDKDFSEQPEPVQQAMRKLGITGRRWDVDVIGDGADSGRYVFHDAIEARDFAQMQRKNGADVKVYQQHPGDSSGEQIYRSWLGGYDSPKHASEDMLRAGIKGIRYLDQGSRNRFIVQRRIDETPGGRQFTSWVVLDRENLYKRDSTDNILARFDTKEEAEANAESRRTYNYVVFDDSIIKITHENGQERYSLADSGEAIADAEAELKAAIRQHMNPPAGMTKADALKAKNDAAMKLRQLQFEAMQDLTSPAAADAPRTPEETSRLIAETVDLFNAVQDEISELNAQSKPIPPAYTKMRNDLQARLKILKGWADDAADQQAAGGVQREPKAPVLAEDRVRQMTLEAATNPDRPTFGQFWDALKRGLRYFASPIPELPMTGELARKSALFRRGFRLFTAETNRVRQEAAERVKQVLEPLESLRTRADNDRLKRYYRLGTALDRARQAMDEQRVALLSKQLADLEQAGVNADPFNLFRKLVLYRDLWWRGTYLKTEQGKPITLPNGLTIDEIAAELRTLQQQLAVHPQKAAITEALKRHYKLTDDLQKAILDHGEIIPEALKNPLYFPHHILEHWSGNIDKVRPSTEEDFRKYLIAPVGSGKLIQADYLKAMYLHTADVLAHNARVDLVKKYWQGYDISERLKAEHGDNWDKPWNLPPGYKLFAPFKKLPLRMDYILSREVLADKLGVLFNDGDLRARMGEAGRVLKVNPEDLHAAMVAGEKIKWAVPEEIADALEGISRREAARSNPGLGHALGTPFRGLNNFWKRVKLFAPWNWIRYEYGNLATDVVDKVLVADPRIASYLKQAAGEIINASRKGEKSEAFKAASREGVFDTITASEAGELQRLREFAEFQSTGETARNTVHNFLAATTKASHFREATFRYAKFLADVDRMKRGEQPIYAGAYHEDIEALGDTPQGQQQMLQGDELTYAKAAEISLKTFGDYNSLGVISQWLRTYAVPFWSWQDVNFRYHANQLRNIADGLRGIRGGTPRQVALKYAAARVVLTLTAVAIAQQLWNTIGGQMLGLWDDDDDLESQLSAADRRRSHVILGKDKNGQVLVVYTPSAFADVAEWVGGLNMKRLFLEYAKGDITLEQFISDYAKQLPNDVANKVAQSVGPLGKGPYEAISGQATFPDVLDQRKIPAADRWWRLAGGMTDDRAVNWMRNVFDKDYYSQPANEQLQQMILQVRRRDPEQWAYYEAREDAADWKEKKTGKRFEGGSYDAPEAQVLRNFRRSIYRGDVAAAEQFYRRLLDYGYTSERLDASIRAQHPLADLSKEQRAEYLQQLDARGRRELELAESYYSRIGDFDKRERRLFPSNYRVKHGTPFEPNEELLRELMTTREP